MEPKWKQITPYMYRLQITGSSNPPADYEELMNHIFRTSGDVGIHTLRLESGDGTEFLYVHVNDTVDRAN